MTGRQRVLAAFNFEQSDRVPLDINANRSSGINVTAYRELRKYLNLPVKPVYIYDHAQQLAIVERDVLDYFDADTFQLGCDLNKKPEYWQNCRLEDGTICKIPANVNWCPPMPVNYKNPRELNKLREIATETRDSTDRAIYGAFGGSLFETGCSAFGMDNFLCDLLNEPDRAREFLDELTEKHLEDLKAYLDAVGKYIDIIGFNDDMGLQNAPFFSPETYMEFFYKRQKMMYSFVHDHFPGLKICLHCCGAVRQLIPLFIDAGLDAINPVQFDCKGMALPELKKEFYGKLTFWGGGCNSENMLPDIKPEDIRNHVNENCKIMNKGGGFIFQPVHNILSGMPAENIVQMYKTVREFE